MSSTWTPGSALSPPHRQCCLGSRSGRRGPTANSKSRVVGLMRRLSAERSFQRAAWRPPSDVRGLLHALLAGSRSGSESAFEPERLRLRPGPPSADESAWVFIRATPLVRERHKTNSVIFRRSSGDLLRNAWTPCTSSWIERHPASRVDPLQPSICCQSSASCVARDFCARVFSRAGAAASEFSRLLGGFLNSPLRLSSCSP